MGDQHARFRKGVTTIDAKAPHLGFVMNVTYMHQDFMKAMQAGTKANESARRERERSAL
ncbi:MAG: hypothetical protein RBT67_02415 [Thauera sp.]|nr:hypothetical protein [Thauera sp.]